MARMTRLAEVLADFATDDPAAWDGLPFTTHLNPLTVGRGFVDFLSDEMDKLDIQDDPWALGDLLNDLLQSQHMTEDELTHIGKAILAER